MRYLITFAAMILPFAAAAQDEPIGMKIFPNCDFELGTLEGWTLEGEAFAYQPTHLDNVTARRADRRAMPQGKYWLGTFEQYQGRPGVERGHHQGDKPIGGLISEAFIIKLPVITFLVGGGDQDVEVSLIVNGAAVRTATGADHPLMRRVYWDVSEWDERQAMIYIYDRATGYFGFVNADDFRYVSAIPDRSLFANSGLAEGTVGWTAEGEAFADGAVSTGGTTGKLVSPAFSLTGDAIAFTMTGGKGTGVRLLVDGKAVAVEKPRSADDARHHVWDLKPWKGKEAVIEVFDESAEPGGKVAASGFHWGR